MSEMNVRSDAVDVEQIMRQIRARIREKRGADYTEAEIQQLATVKLEKFLDPRGLRSDLVAQYRKQRVVPPAPPNYEFGETTLYETHRGPLSALRRLFRPLLKLFFNPDKITSVLHLQSEINRQAEERLRRLEEREPLSYELLHNLTLEITRLGIEVHNLKMRVESLTSRMDFDERRARSLETVVEYRQPRQNQGGGQRQGGQNQPQRQPAPVVPITAAQNTGAAGATSTSSSENAGGGAPGAMPGGGQQGQDGSQTGNGERRRRRRRRRRRPGSTLANAQGQTWAPNAGADSGDDAGGSDAGSDADADADELDDTPDPSDATDQ
jgi:hypothetical protein